MTAISGISMLELRELWDMVDGACECLEDRQTRMRGRRTEGNGREACLYVRGCWKYTRLCGAKKKVRLDELCVWAARDGIVSGEVRLEL